MKTTTRRMPTDAKICGLSVADWSRTVGKTFTWPFKSHDEMLAFAKEKDVDVTQKLKVKDWEPHEIDFVVALVAGWAKADEIAVGERDDKRNYGMPMSIVNGFAKALGKTTYADMPKASGKRPQSDVDRLFDSLTEAGIAYWYSPRRTTVGNDGRTHSRPLVFFGAKRESESAVGRALAELLK